MLLSVFGIDLTLRVWVALGQFVSPLQVAESSQLRQFLWSCSAQCRPFKLLTLPRCDIPPSSDWRLNPSELAACCTSPLPRDCSVGSADEASDGVVLPLRSEVSVLKLYRLAAASRWREEVPLEEGCVDRSSEIVGCGRADAELR